MKPYFAKSLDLTGKGVFKPYLCSRDIQVGDKVFDTYSGLEIEVTNQNFPSNASDFWVKKIGEISPEVTWVKEGDEFDENEWKIAWFKELYGIIRKTHDYEPSDDVLSMFKEGDFQKFIQIKGPCGHFH